MTKLLRSFLSQLHAHSFKVIHKNKPAYYSKRSGNVESIDSFIADGKIVKCSSCFATFFQPHNMELRTVEVMQE